VAVLWLTVLPCKRLRAAVFRISVSAAAALDAAFRSRVGCAVSTEGVKEVPSMSEDKKKELETVDITGLADEELDDIVGGAGGDATPTGEKHP
jgi:hypothetical protein